MKTIKEEQLDTILGLDQTGILGRLPLPMLEKDIHLTDFLARLSRIEIRHEHFKGLKNGETAVDDGIKLVFCGGTSLSKAQSMIERMSEDVDLKVVLSAPNPSEYVGERRFKQPKMLKNGIGATSRMKALHRDMLRLVEKMGFGVPSINPGDRPNPHIRDKHRYWAARLQYENRLGHHAAIRPELKIEVIHRHPRMATVPIRFGYLHDRFTGLPEMIDATVEMQGIDLAETVAEKTVSLLRRSHWNWFGNQERPLDLTLVRHVYDVCKIAQSSPDVATRATDIFQLIVKGDSEEFRGRDPEFDTNPASAMRKTLETGRHHADRREKYSERLVPLIYAKDIPTFDEALDSFSEIAEKLLSSLEPPRPKAKVSLPKRR